MAGQLHVHVNILAWTGFEEKAKIIEKALIDHADSVSVIYSVPEGGPEVPHHWVRVDYDCFFGCKFQKAITLHPGGVMLQIQADAHSDNWPELLGRCRQAFTDYPELGVWGPQVDYSMWSLDRVYIDSFEPENSLVSVRQTDGIVWALSEPVIERMRQADYSGNRLGWGIDSLAIAFAFSHNMLVLRDTSLQVHHPKGAGYGADEAAKQLEWFLKQFSAQERIQMKITRIPKTKLKTRDLLYLLARRIFLRD